MTNLPKHVRDALWAVDRGRAGFDEAMLLGEYISDMHAYIAELEAERNLWRNGAYRLREEVRS